MARTTSTDKSQDVKALLSKKKPRIIKQPVLLDSEAAEAYQVVKAAFDEVNKRKLLAGREVPEDLEFEYAQAKKRLDDAEKVLDEATLVFKFRALGRTEMEELLGDHPPTKKQIAEAKAEGNPDLGFNPETYPQALIAAASVEPDLSPEDVESLWEDPDWTSQELLLLFVAAQKANAYVDVEALKKGSGRIPS